MTVAAVGTSARLTTPTSSGVSEREVRIGEGAARSLPAHSSPCMKADRPALTQVRFHPPAFTQAATYESEN